LVLKEVRGTIPGGSLPQAEEMTRMKAVRQEQNFSIK
jgi:hypothetical protein